MEPALRTVSIFMAVIPVDLPDSSRDRTEIMGEMLNRMIAVVRRTYGL